MGSVCEAPIELYPLSLSYIPFVHPLCATCIVFMWEIAVAASTTLAHKLLLVPFISKPPLSLPPLFSPY